MGSCSGPTELERGTALERLAPELERMDTACASATKRADCTASYARATAGRAGRIRGEKEWRWGSEEREASLDTVLVENCKHRRVSAIALLAGPSV